MIWKWSESALKVLWKCSEVAKKLLLISRQQNGQLPRVMSVIWHVVSRFHLIDKLYHTKRPPSPAFSTGRPSSSGRPPAFGNAVSCQPWLAVAEPSFPSSARVWPCCCSLLNPFGSRNRAFPVAEPEPLTSLWLGAAIHFITEIGWNAKGKVGETYGVGTQMTFDKWVTTYLHINGAYFQLANTWLTPNFPVSLIRLIYLIWFDFILFYFSLFYFIIIIILFFFF